MRIACVGAKAGHPEHFPAALFFIHEERIVGLEFHLNELRAQARAVEEKLARFTAAGQLSSQVSGSPHRHR
jgi:hypothetical protein